MSMKTKNKVKKSSGEVALTFRVSSGAMPT
jgi:hypothetical protein